MVPHYQRRLEIYFIPSSEINAYQKQIKVISITSAMISAYIFTVAFFFITSDFSIHLMHFTSEPQAPITFLFVNEKHQVRVCVFLDQNYLGLLKIFVFAFSAPPFSVGETLHVAYKSIK